MSGRWRIRRCHGNRAAWLLVALGPDGSESEASGSYTTSTSIDALLTGMRGPCPKPGDYIQLVLTEDSRAAWADGEGRR